MITPSRTQSPSPSDTRDPYESVAGMYDLFAAAQGDAAPPRVSAFTEPAQPGMRVLDVGAGTGRVALAVAERGADVHCVEPSATMRSALLVKLAQRPALWPRVTVSAGQAPALGVDGSFDYAYLAGSLQFLDKADRLATFVELAAHLRSGAILAFDMVGGTPDLLVPDDGETVVAEATVGRNRYLMTARVVAASAHGVRIRYSYVIEGGGRRTVHTMERPRFFHGFDQVRADLIAAGFTVDGTGEDGWPDLTRPVTARRSACAGPSAARRT